MTRKSDAESNVIDESLLESVAAVVYHPAGILVKD
jgi:hypothetical protein